MSFTLILYVIHHFIARKFVLEKITLTFFCFLEEEEPAVKAISEQGSYVMYYIFRFIKKAAIKNAKIH